jgi:TP901 family phage tail tape measure protein
VDRGVPATRQKLASLGQGLNTTGIEQLLVKAEAGLRNVGAVAGTAGANIKTGMQGAESALSVLAEVITANKVSVADYTREVLDARGGLAELAQRVDDARVRFGANSDQVKVLRGEYSSLSAATRGLIAEKAQLANETRALEAALKEEQSQISPLAQAFQDLGIKSQASLNETAAKAQAAYALISESGQASSADLVRASEAVNKALAAQNAGLRELPAAIDPVANAYKELGIKSQASLQAAAAKAQQAFNTIATSGKASAEDLIRAQAAVDKALAATTVEIKKQQSGFQRFRESFGSVSTGLIGGGAILVGLFGGISAGIGKLVLDASHLQEEFVHVAANTAMTDAQFEQMRSTVLSLGATSNKSFGDIAEGYMRVTNHGYEANAATQVLDASLKAATATGAAAASTANALAVVMHDFHAPASEAARIMDALTIASAKGNLTLQAFVDSSGKMISTASQLHVPLADVLAAMSSLTSTGRTAAAASTEVTAAMVKIVNPTKQAREEIARLSKATGVDLVHDFSLAGLQSKGLSGIIEDLRKAVGDHTDEILKLIAAQRGGLGMMALVSTSYEDFKQRVDLVNQALRGELTPTMDGFERATQTMAFQVERFSNRMQLLGVMLQTALGGQFVSTLEKASDGLLNLIGFLQNIPPAAITAGVAFTTAAAAVGAASIVISGMVALMGGPLTLAVVGLGIDVGILAGLFVTNFGHINEAFGQFFKGGSASLKGVAFAIGVIADGISIVARVVVSAVDAMLTALNALGRSFLATVGIAKGFGEVIVGIGTMDVGRVAAGIDQIRTAVEKEGETLRNVFSGLASREFARMNESVENFQGKWANSLSSAVDKAGSFAANVKNFAGGVADQLSKMRDAATKHLNDTGDGFESAGKKAKKAKDEVFAAVQDWLKATNGLEISATVWGKLTDAVKKTFKDQADEFHKNIDAAQTWRANLLALVLNLGFEVEKATNGLGFSFKKLSDTIVVEFTKLSTSISGITEGVGPMFDDLQKRSAEATALLVSDSQKRVGRYNEEQAALAKGHDALMLAFDELSHSIPSAWNKVIDGILTASGRVGDSLVQFGVKIKGWANDVFQVFNTLPGAWGKVTQSIFKTIDQWASFFNSILGLLHRFIAAVPSSLSDLIANISNLFKGAQSGMSGVVVSTTDTMAAGAKAAATGVASAGSQISAATESTSSKFVAGFGAMTAAIGGFAAALGISASSPNKTVGFLGSLASSTIAGILAGLQFGPVTGAIVGGISLVGGIIGLFTGKSAAQKEKERLDNEKLKADIGKTVQDTLNAALEGIKTALDLAPFVAEFEGPGKQQIQSLFKFMTRLINNFVEMAKSWSGANLAQAKAAAENIGPVFDVIANVPQAATAINSTFDVSDIQVSKTFSILDKIVDAWEVEADKWLGGPAKRIGKVADKLAPAVNLTAPLTEAIKAVNEVEIPSDEKLGIVGVVLDKIIVMFNGLAERYAKPLLKSIQNVGEKLAPVLTLEKDTVELIKASVDIEVPKASAADNVATGMRQFVDALVAAFTDFNTAGLGVVLAIVLAISPVASAVKAWVETAALVRDYSAVGVDKWQQVAADFATGGQTIHLLEANALAMRDEAALFDVTMHDWKAHVTSGFQAYYDGSLAAASLANGVLNALNVPQVPITGGDTLGGSGGSFSSQSFSTFAPEAPAVPFTPSAPASVPFVPTGAGSSGGNSSSQTIQFNAPIYLNGKQAPAAFGREFANEVIRVLQSQKKKGGLKTEIV